MAVEIVHLKAVRHADAFVKTECGLQLGPGIRAELLLTPAVTCPECRAKAEGRKHGR